MKKYMVFVGMGFELIAVTLACLYLGQEVEKRYPLKNLWSVLFIFAGLAGWFYRVIVLLRKMNQEKTPE
ncbi:MAG: AtpZ/AtpI family protein [Bdellovibrionales bacterium]